MKVVVGIALFAFAASDAQAEPGECHVVDVRFTPAMQASSSSQRHEPSQIVVWIEKPTGEYVDTMFITQQTGRYGLGNRPGRFDFNSGPMFPYGRRTTTFPVWAHKKPQTFPAVVFQSCCGYERETDDPEFCMTQVNDPNAPLPYDRAHMDCSENNLSHAFNVSTIEQRYCEPLMPNDPQWAAADAMTCATSAAFTDKGKFSTTATSLYPPRADLSRLNFDSPAVDLMRTMNMFDAVSNATPPPGMPARAVWTIPELMFKGDYVLWVEVAQAFDHNATYSVDAYPALPASGEKGIAWAGYGLPYRGQPSIVYKVPFTIGDTMSSTSTATWAGYGDPDGRDGNVRAPDATITTDTPGSGASRLQLVSEDGLMYRVLVNARPEYDYVLPSTMTDAQAVDIKPTSATLRFIAPGDDGNMGTVAGYEIRYLANQEMTADNFAQGARANALVQPVQAGTVQHIELTGLLPETDYYVGIRAFDDCRNTSDIVIVKLTTADRIAGEVDACFVATAAYGSLMANDVELLRHFRDATLRQSIFGELAITSYYTFGPALSGVVGESDFLRSFARAALAPVIAYVRHLRF